MGIVWHPVVFESEKIDWPDKPWIQPFVIPDNDNVTNYIDIGYHKNNAFVRSGLIKDKDYYLFLDDDDMIRSRRLGA